MRGTCQRREGVGFSYKPLDDGMTTVNPMARHPRLSGGCSTECGGTVLPCYSSAYVAEVVQEDGIVGQDTV
jgi:hypothetical protein